MRRGGRRARRPIFLFLLHTPVMPHPSFSARVAAYCRHRGALVNASTLYCRTFSAHVLPTPPLTGRVARFNIEHGDAAELKQFYVDAFQLRERRLEDGNRLRVELGDGIGLSCSVVTFVGGPGKSIVPADAALVRAPGLTIAVSNLATTARQVVRRGGGVGEPSFSNYF